MTDESFFYRKDWEYRRDGSMFLTETTEVTKHVEQALEFAEQNYRNRTLFHLREALGEDTGKVQVGNHVFVEGQTDDMCICTGCELKIRDPDTLERAAERVDCPAKLEMFERYLDDGGF